MGKILKFKDMKLNSVLIVSFLMITLFSLAATVITVGFTAEYIYDVIFNDSEFEHIEAYIKEKGALLLEQGAGPELEKVLKPYKIKYQVLDENLSVVYGNLQNEQYENSSAASGAKVITGQDGRILRLYAFNNGTKRIYLLLSEPEIAASNELIVIMIIILIPIIFIVLFTIIFSVILRGRIGKPLKQLMEAAGKVKKHDLDFTLDYKVDDEIGTLFNSFKEMQAELKLTLQREWENKKNEKDMIAAINHDLNTPLTVIQCSSDILLNGLLDNREKLIKHLASISKNAARASKLLEEIKTISSIENTPSELNLQKIEIHDFINEKADNYTVIAEKANLTFEFYINSSCSLNQTAVFDPEKISRVLDNLITNSIRYTEPGGKIRLDIEIKKDTISFSVRDTGQGFKDKDIPCLFNKFYKSDESRSREKMHLGLGLYICRMIIEAHGGTITAENNVPKGAFINFIIPNVSNLKPE